MKKLRPKLSHIKLNNKYLIICITLLITIPLGLMLFSPKTAPPDSPDVLSFPQLQSESAASPTGTSQNNSELIDAVSSLMELPAGEEPFIATVTDPSALQDQSFFRKAQVGDKVLVYQNAKLAILYRPTTYKIISTSEAIIQINQPDDSASTSASASISAAITKPLTKILK